MQEKDYQKEIIELGYDENNQVPKLTPIYSKDKKDIYLFNNYYGIVFTYRGIQDKHVLIIMLKNNGTWQKESVDEFSNYWIRDMNELFNFAEKYLKTSNLFQKTEYGY